MNKKLLLAMSVALMMYGVSCTTGNDPGIKYTDHQLQEIAEAEEHMKSADFKNPETAEKACILGDVEALKKMEQAGFDGLNDSQYILLAAEYGRLECCRYLVENGADVNAKYYGETVLHNAAESGSLELCKYLIEKGANVNAKNAWGVTVLHEAALSGSVEVCKYLIEKGANVNAKDKYGQTVLHEAAESGNVEVYKYLIEHGADVNAKNEYDETVLHEAAEEGRVDLCKCLIEHGADVNVKNDISGTLLHCAAESGSVELCKYLIEKGADVNAETVYGWTILHCAAESGSLELCKYLIEKGANVNAKNVCSWTILHCAAKSGNVELCKYLIGLGLNVNAEDKDGQTVLHEAAESGNAELCKYLIGLGPDVNAKNKNDKTVLHFAAKSGNLELCKYLIEHGANINAMTWDGTILHCAAKSGNLELCKYLIGLGLDVNAKDKDGQTVLHYAEFHKIELCKYLIEHGADVNAKGRDGKTALHEAAESGNVELCKYLIEHGADVNAEDKDGKTALHEAAERGSLELCKYLIEQHGADVKAMTWGVLYDAVQSGSLELCKYLIEQHGADVKAMSWGGWTVLHMAAESGSVDLCKYLVGLGLDVNAIDNNGMTVLHMAATSGSVDLCEYLVGLGLNVNARDNDGITVLHMAAGSGHGELCKYLVEHGAEVNAKSNGGVTVLLCAATSRRRGLCRYLVEHGANVNAKTNGGVTVLRSAAENVDLICCKYLVEHGAEVKGMKVSLKWDGEIKEYLLSKGGILEGTEKKQEEQSAGKEDAVHYVAGISADGKACCAEVKKTTEENPSEQEIEAEFETMKGEFGSAYALYVKLRRYQFLLKKKPDAAMQTKAFAVADEIIRTAPKSQFAEAARYLKGVIQADQLSDQSEAKAVKAVKKYLEDFIKENPDGLYRGEALMLLGKISLECEWDADTTEKYYKMAFDYYQKAGGKQSADPLPENLKRQAAPTQRMATLDSCCYVEYHEEDPLKLYNTANTPAWYADDCKKACVIVLGTCLYHQGKYDEAKKMWGKIIDLDPDTRQLQSRAIPNLLMRLQASCDDDEKGMVITEKMRHQMSKKLRLPTLWGQVLMLIGNFDASKALFTKLKSQAQKKNDKTAILMVLGEVSVFCICFGDLEESWAKLGEETFLEVYKMLEGSNTPEEREALLRYIGFLRQSTDTSSLSVPYARIYIEKYPDDIQYPWMLRILLIDELSKKNVKEVKRLYEEICSIKGTGEIQEQFTEEKSGYFDMYGYDPETGTFKEKKNTASGDK